MTYYVQARYKRGGPWGSLVSFPTGAAAECLVAGADRLPRDRDGNVPVQVRVIRSDDLAREKTIARAAAGMVRRAKRPL